MADIDTHCFVLGTSQYLLPRCSVYLPSHGTRSREGARIDPSRRWDRFFASFGFSRSEVATQPVCGEPDSGRAIEAGGEHVQTDRRQLLAHLADDAERLIGARVLDIAHICLEQGEPVASDFLDPHARQIALGVLGAVAGVGVRAFGGYPKAERQRLLIYPDYYLTELLEPPLRAAEVRGGFSYEQVTHRDFLGAVLATGLRREHVGDILMIPGGCQVILTGNGFSVVLAELREVHRFPVNVTEIDLEQLAVEPERVKEIRTTVASMRLDAVAALGFGISRTKMAREIKAERIKLNWRGVTDPARAVEKGDVISMRGRGRVSVQEVTGTTRKGRTALLLTRTF